MGARELLDKEKEVQIAMEIEKGDVEVLSALAKWNGVIDGLITRYKNHPESKLYELISGFTDILQDDSVTIDGEQLFFDEDNGEE